LAVARLLLHLEIQIVFFRSRYSCPTCGNVFYVVSKWHRKIVIAFFPAIFLSNTIFHSSNIRQYYVLRAPIVYKLFIMAKQGKFFYDFENNLCKAKWLPTFLMLLDAS
jgi:hypothetical protein